MTCRRLRSTPSSPTSHESLRAYRLNRSTGTRGPTKFPGVTGFSTGEACNRVEGMDLHRGASWRMSGTGPDVLTVATVRQIGRWLIHMVAPENKDDVDRPLRDLEELSGKTSKLTQWIPVHRSRNPSRPTPMPL